jgi:hypothetical protein
MSSVYAIGHGPSGTVKIGVSSNVLQRVAS